MGASWWGWGLGNNDDSDRERTPTENDHNRPRRRSASEDAISRVPREFPIIERGLRLEALLMIAQDIKDKRANLPDDIKELSPGDQIVTGFVKPVTAKHNLSYVEHFYQKYLSRNLVGECNTFLSHPWSGNFEDLIAALSEYEKNLPEKSQKNYYFVDYFAVNQHYAYDDLNTLSSLIQNCKTLVLMAKPWEKPVALTRIWCIFELAHAVIGKNDIFLILPPEDQKRFLFKLRVNANNLWSFLDFKNIDSGNAQATNPKDQEDIKKFIQEWFGGFASVDNMISERLRFWFVQSVKSLVERSEAKKGSIEHASLLTDVASFYFSQGMYSDSARLYKEAEDIYRKANDPPNWLACEYNTIRILSRTGKLEDALQCSIKNVNRSIKELGAMSDQTLDSQKLLGDIKRQLGFLAESEKILREVLKAHENTKHYMSDDVIESMVSLTETLREAGKYKEAEKMLQVVIERRTKKYGRSSCLTLNSVSKYARCIALDGNSEKAISLYEEALPNLRLSYGDSDMVVEKCDKWYRELKEEIAKNEE